MMTEKLYLVRTGCGRRLERGLELALQDLPAEELDAGQLAGNGREKRLVFAVHVDEFGPDGSFLQLLRLLRQKPGCLRGSFGVIVVDGDGELYTKQAARELARVLNSHLRTRSTTMPIHVNLIPVNPIKERDYRQSDRRRIREFKDYLEKSGINVTVRREMGRDIGGACGQLRKSFMDEERKGG